MGTTYYHGRRVTSTDTDFSETGTNNQRFYVPDKLTTTIIAYRMEMLGGRLSGYGNPNVRLAISTAPGAGTPGALLRYTSEFAPSNIASSGSTGQVHGANLTTPLIMAPEYYGLGLATRSNPAGVVMTAAGRITATNERFYTKSGLASNIPTDPVGGTGTTQGHMDLWVVGVTNTAPKIPTSLSPSGTLTNGDLTPQLQSTFADDEITLPNGVAFDKLNQVQVQVRRVSDGVVFWDNTYNATTGEQDAKRADRTYAGTALVAGTAYEWRTRHSDLAGAWGGWSGWVSFTVSAAGSVAQPTSPTGKQISATPGPFVAKWSHQNGLSTNAVEVRLLLWGVVIRNSPTITKSVANNGTISISHAEAAWSAMVSGSYYTFQIRGRDTNGVWSTWSPEKEFWINATPSVPSQLNPGGSQIVTALPLLTMVSSDPDNDTDQLVPNFQIVRADGTTVTRTGTYNASTGRFQYQVTSTDIPSYQTFTWRASARDAHFWESAYSNYETVVYAQGPTVTVTYPTVGATVTVHTPTITWTATDQVSRRVRIFRTSDDQTIVDSGTTTTTSQSYVVPSGKLRNDTDYYAIVDVTNSVPLSGSSGPITFRLQYVAPPAIDGFNTYAITVGYDTSPSSITIEWGMTQYPANQFIGYDLYRRPVGGTFAASEPQDELRLRRITSPLQTAFVDYHPRSGVMYEYRLVQVLQMGLDELVSESVTGQASVDLDGIVVASALNPATYRMNLQYLARGNPSHSLDIGQRQVVPVGARTGRTLRTGSREWDAAGSFMILDNAVATADARIKQIRDAVEQPSTFSYRDHKGRKLWVTVQRYTETSIGHYYQVDIIWREEYFVEGEPADVPATIDPQFVQHLIDIIGGVLS